MVEVLRRDEAPKDSRRRIGLVTNLSGIFGKQGCAVFSTTPNREGYAYEDVTATVAEKDPPIPLNGEYVGPATVVGYTVVFTREAPSHAIAICDTPNGERTVVRTADRAMLERMTQEEFCGQVIQVLADGWFDRGDDRPIT